jgi:restriction system protein
MTPMTDKEPQSSEIAVSKTLTEFMSKIGFNVQFSDTNPRLKNPDFIAQKRIDGTEYKIAIELKSNSNINDAIKNGIKTLTSVNAVTNYDKLLLLLLNRDNRNIQNSALKNFLSNNPTNLEIINLDDLEKWSKSLSDELSPKEQNEVFFYIKQLSKKFIELVAKNPEYLKNLEWRDLERTISELFEGIGFKTTLTPSSKDGGKDVILEYTIDNIQKTFIIEIKHWRSGQKVGQTAVKEFTQVIINEKREKGLFLSTYGFTGNYYESLSEKQKSIIRFGDKEKIVELCKTYEKVNNGIWNPIHSLENILFDNTIVLEK